jgi:hypothetical protein
VSLFRGVLSFMEVLVGPQTYYARSPRGALGPSCEQGAAKVRREQDHALTTNTDQVVNDVWVGEKVS